MKNYIKLMRPQHYIKNFLIFFPLIFSGQFFNLEKLASTLFAFLAFSFCASVVYIINDINDKEKDCLHEKKKNRPIASGSVSVKNAIIFAILLFLISIFFEYLSVSKIFHISFIYLFNYLFINILYSLGLKNIPLIDIFILAMGFLIRVVFGASTLNIEVSNWLYLTIMAVAFYLGLGKRRNEIKRSGNKSREVLKYYNESFLDKNMYMCLSLSIVFYALWTVDSNNVIKFGNKLVLTVPFIILILMKYSLNIESDSLGDPVDLVLSDKTLFILILLYGIVVMTMIYT